MQKLVSKSKLAELAGVNPSTVTRLCKTLLAGAVVGKKIDLAHPDAIAYLEKRDGAPPPVDPVAPGIDPVYTMAVEACQAEKNYTAAFIQKTCRVGNARAKTIINMMAVAGLIPESKPKDTPAPTPAPAPKPKPRGNAVVKARKQAEAAERFAARQNEPSPEPAPPVEIPFEIASVAHMTLTELIETHGTEQAFSDWLKALKTLEEIQEKRLKNAEKAGELISRKVVEDGLISTIDGAFTRMLTDGARSIAARSYALATAGEELTVIEDMVAKQLTSFIRPTKSKITRVLGNV